jgi:7-cyano-7-deazaguanine synthase in queuosine biosynthesis
MAQTDNPKDFVSMKRRAAISRADLLRVWYSAGRAGPDAAMWLANELGVLQDLLELTRSCEGGPVETEKFTKECGVCWWCLERQWGYQNYKKTDLK